MDGRRGTQSTQITPPEHVLRFSGSDGCDRRRVRELANSPRRVLRSILEFVMLAVLTGCVPLVVLVDVSILGNAISEHSLTEYLQSALLLFTAVSFACVASNNSDRRGFFVLMSGLFGCMFIREQNALLDQVWNGLWFYAAMTLAVLTVVYATKYTDTILSTAYDYIDTRSAVSLSTGLVVVLIFSRIFGTLHLWSSILPYEHSGMAKKVVQEGLELFGYLFIAFGAYTYSSTRVAWNVIAGTVTPETDPAATVESGMVAA